jgi:hypothetical protein
MKIIVNGTSMENVPVQGENLEDILYDLQKSHLSGAIVGEILVNGSCYEEDVPHAAIEVDLDEIQTLELTTLTTEEIGRHFLANGGSMLRAMLSALPKITEMFRLGDEAEANEHYLRLLESLQFFLTTLKTTSAALGIEFINSDGNDTPLEIKLQRVSDIFSDLLRIQEQNDWIYLADILDYDLTPELISLEQGLPELKGNIH